MITSPFHAFVKARELENSGDLLAVYASSNIEVYPYQIAAAQFALRSPYLRGVILCSEASLGKSYEAMLVAVQKWYEGENVAIKYILARNDTSRVGDRPAAQKNKRY